MPTSGEVRPSDSKPPITNNKITVLPAYSTTVKLALPFLSMYHYSLESTVHTQVCVQGIGYVSSCLLSLHYKNKIPYPISHPLQAVVPKWQQIRTWIKVDIQLNFTSWLGNKWIIDHEWISNSIHYSNQYMYHLPLYIHLDHYI